VELKSHEKPSSPFDSLSSARSSGCRAPGTRWWGLEAVVHQALADVLGPTPDESLKPARIDDALVGNRPVLPL